MSDPGFDALLNKALSDPVFRRALNTLTAIQLGCVNNDARLAQDAISSMCEMMLQPKDR
jgi:hypothetical protein